jgi:hypothetical protein
MWQLGRPFRSWRYSATRNGLSLIIGYSEGLFERGDEGQVRGGAQVEQSGRVILRMLLYLEARVNHKQDEEGRR